MNKQIFIKELNKSLKGLPEDEKQDIIQDFQEHFSAGFREDKTEEDIASNLGNPRQIGKELRVSSHLDKVKNEQSVGSVLSAVWSVIGLSFFNLIIVLGPVLFLASLLFAAWTVSVTFVFTPLFVGVNVIFFPESFMWFDVFSSLVLSGVSILAGIGLYYLTRLFIKGIVKYLHFNVKMVKGGVRHA